MNAQNDLIDAMVANFLSWKLPSDFSPDCGISFTPPSKPSDECLYAPWPTGTNLLNAKQARDMVLRMLDGYSVYQMEIKKLEFKV